MIEAKVREKYRGASRRELLDKAYELGCNYTEASGFCAQCAAAAIHELLEIDDVVVRVANSTSGGGVGKVFGTCGALIGGGMVLDYFFGRPVEEMSKQPSTQASRDTAMAAKDIVALLYDRYLNDYGAIHCAQMQQKLYGRAFWLEDTAEHDMLLETIARSDPKRTCFSLVGNTARWVLEILLDKGAVKLK